MTPTPHRRTCDYLVPGEHGRQKCGCPATHARNATPAGLFYYCATHAAHASEATRGRIHLIKLDPE